VSDTPRTDSLLTAILDLDGYVAHRNCPPTWVSHARELERELNAVTSEVERLRKANLQLREGAEEQKQRIKRLEEAGVWQPIETAPTDMTWVIGYDAKDGEVGTIIFDLTGDVDDEDVHYEWTDGMRTWNPTHWMPLPEPPEAKEAKP